MPPLRGFVWAEFGSKLGQRSTVPVTASISLSRQHYFSVVATKYCQLNEASAEKLSWIFAMQGCWRHAEVTSSRLPGVNFFLNGDASQSFPFNKQMEAALRLFSFCLNLCTGFCIINCENIVKYNWISIPFQGRHVVLFPNGTNRGFSFHSIFMCRFFKAQEGTHAGMKGNS